MSHTTTTVVTRQVTSSGQTTNHVITGNREWQSGLFRCTEDCKNCTLVTFCGPCCAGNISRRVGEHCCVPCIAPGGLTTLRVKVRLMLGIRGSIFRDCLLSTCCPLCVICQMKRELDSAGWPKLVSHK